MNSTDNLPTSSRVFISADHGLAVIYFLQSDVVPTLLNAGVEVVLLTDEALKEAITQRFGAPGLTVESLRLREANDYYRQVSHEVQWWLYFLRRVGCSRRINVAATQGYIHQVSTEEGWKRRALLPLAKAFIALMRRSRRARQMVVNLQTLHTPPLYTDLFERYRPHLVVASTPGWRLDRYVLRQAAARGIPTAAVIVGWDNPSSYCLSGAPVQWITCWSEIQKRELVLGSDWPPERVNVGGIPSYDGYFRKQWLMPRDEYFALHGLDPQRKLISYAASFVSFHPGYENVAALARLVAADALAAPSQLLIRLHPNHFMDNHLYVGERERIRQLARETPHVHVVEPVPLGGSLGYYSGEDMPEKTSMMAYSDVFTTVYSTMVVETAIHDRPVVSVCIDTPGGWNWPRKVNLPFSQIGNWPTHQRFRQAGAGRVAVNEAELRDLLNLYLQHPETDAENRRKFIADECTFTDGSAGRRTGEYLLSLLDRHSSKVE